MSPARSLCATPVLLQDEELESLVVTVAIDERDDGEVSRIMKNEFQFFPRIERNVR